MCIFCKIANKEIPSYKVYEDDYVYSFLDLSQATIGHTLVIPKKHFDNIFELDADTAGKVFQAVQKIAKAVKEATKCEGVNILNNNGPVAGQSVNHFHIHIIPRYNENDITIKFNENKITEDEFNKIANNINNNIK